MPNISRGTSLRVLTPVARSFVVLILVVSCWAGCGRDGTPLAGSDAHHLCEEGTSDLQAFRFREAADKLGLCLELDPGLVEAAIARAEAFANLRDQAAAARELARADSLAAGIADDRRRMLAQLRLSRVERSCYSTIGDSLLDRLSREDPDNLHVLVARASRAAGAGDTDDAVRVWERVLEVNPNHVVAYNQLGYLELGRARYKSALEQFKKYMFLAPDLANPHDSYGEVLMILGRYEEAEREFVAALNRQPDFYHSLINLGRCHLARGQIRKGEEILAKVRSEVSGAGVEREVDLRILMAHLVADRQDRLTAISREYVARYPKDPLAPLLRFLMLVGRGEAEAGYALMDSTLNSRRASIHYKTRPGALAATEIFARQYEGFKSDLSGQPEQAIAAWSDCVRLMQGNTPLHDQLFHRSRLAAARLRNGEAAASLDEIAVILGVNPRLIDVLLLEVEARLALGDAEGAAEALERSERALAAADPDYPPRAQVQGLAARVRALPGS